MNLRLLTSAVALASVLLTGCFDDDDVVVDSSAYRLEPAGSPARLSAHISAGLTLAGGGGLTSQRLVGAPVAFAGVEDMAGAPAAGAGGGGTTTGAASGGAMSGDSSVPADDGLNNVQVNGVEEPDLVKSDGTYLYVAAQPDAWIYPLPVAAPVARRGVPRDGISLGIGTGSIITDIFIHDTTPETPPVAQIARYTLDALTPGVAPLPALELTGATGYLSQLKLLLAGGDAPVLVAIGQSGNDWGWDSWFMRRPYSVAQETRLWFFDLADAENVPAPTSITLKGELVDSRRIDNHLYLVTRYSPTLPTDPLLPSFQVDAVAQPLLNAADCLLPASSAGFPSMTMIVAIDLADPATTHASCYAGDVYTMYMSRDALYLATTRNNPDFDWGTGVGSDPGVGVGADGGGASGVPVAAAAAEEPAPAVAPVDTLVHRFALNNGNPQYSGSGIVAGGFTGWIGTGSHPQWRFHERDGRLFLVTSWWDNTNLHHHLYVLAPNADGDLTVRATLPNAAHPQAIGKPREDIFAIRYVGERAYVVTFRQTDPLYVLDLSDPLNPQVAGELELPGFSAYLHPIGTDWLLGIGRGASGGVEANLFDVRDPALPLVHHNLPICSACETPLLTDYHAIAVQRRDDGITRVALPVQSWATASELSWRPQELAALLEVTQADGQLNLVSSQVADARATALGRVLLIGDAIFQPQNGGVTFGSWPAAM